MSKIKEAQEILKALGLPPAQYNEMAALTLLAVSNIKEQDKWKNATKQSMGVSNGIMNFVNEPQANRSRLSPTINKRKNLADLLQFSSSLILTTYFLVPSYLAMSQCSLCRS